MNRFVVFKIVNIFIFFWNDKQTIFLLKFSLLMRLPLFRWFFGYFWRSSTWRLFFSQSVKHSIWLFIPVKDIFRDRSWRYRGNQRPCIIFIRINHLLLFIFSSQLLKFKVVLLSCQLRLLMMLVLMLLAIIILNISCWRFWFWYSLSFFLFLFFVRVKFLLWRTF